MRGPVSDYDRNSHAGGAVLGCFFPDETTLRRGRYLATGEEQGLTEGDSGTMGKRGRGGVEAKGGPPWLPWMHSRR
jgi:hypothetical protein